MKNDYSWVAEKKQEAMRQKLQNRGMPSYSQRPVSERFGVSYTGLGEDGRLDKSAPAGMDTYPSPHIYHEGETRVATPEGRVYLNADVTRGAGLDGGANAMGGQMPGFATGGGMAAPPPPPPPPQAGPRVGNNRYMASVVPQQQQQQREGAPQPAWAKGVNPLAFGNYGAASLAQPPTPPTPPPPPPPPPQAGPRVGNNPYMASVVPQPYSQDDLRVMEGRQQDAPLPGFAAGGGDTTIGVGVGYGGSPGGGTGNVVSSTVNTGGSVGGNTGSVGGNTGSVGGNTGSVGGSTGLSTLNASGGNPGLKKATAANTGVGVGVAPVAPTRPADFNTPRPVLPPQNSENFYDYGKVEDKFKYDTREWEKARDDYFAQMRQYDINLAQYKEDLEQWNNSNGPLSNGNLSKENPLDGPLSNGKQPPEGLSAEKPEAPSYSTDPTNVQFGRGAEGQWRVDDMRREAASQQAYLQHQQAMRGTDANAAWAQSQMARAQQEEGINNFAAEYASGADERNFAKLNTMAQQMLSSGDPALIAQGAGMIKQIYPGMDFNADGLIDDAKRAAFFGVQGDIQAAAAAGWSWEEFVTSIGGQDGLTALCQRSGMSERDIWANYNIASKSQLDRDWDIITRSPEYQDLTPEEQGLLKDLYFKQGLLGDYEYVYEYNVTDADGKITTTFPTQKEAEKYVEENGGEVVRGKAKDLRLKSDIEREEDEADAEKEASSYKRGDDPWNSKAANDVLAAADKDEKIKDTQEYRDVVADYVDGFTRIDSPLPLTSLKDIPETARQDVLKGIITQRGTLNGFGGAQTSNKARYKNYYTNLDIAKNEPKRLVEFDGGYWVVDVVGDYDAKTKSSRDAYKLTNVLTGEMIHGVSTNNSEKSFEKGRG